MRVIVAATVFVAKVRARVVRGAITVVRMANMLKKIYSNVENYTRYCNEHSMEECHFISVRSMYLRIWLAIS